MKRPMRFVLNAVFVCLAAGASFAQQKPGAGDIQPVSGYKPPAMENSSALQTVLDAAVNETAEANKPKPILASEIAATLIDVSDPGHLKIASIRGNDRIYPASVIKMFYLAAIQRQIETGQVKVTPELTRGLHDMIVDSSNEATQYILDVITGTSSGAELPEKEFQAWQYKRNRVNRYYTTLGYKNINVNQKTFCEDAYGIEQQSRNYKGENRNMLTTDATARLLAEIVMGHVASADRTKQMMDLLKRDPFAGAADTDDQAHGFTGRMLIDRKMADARLWSKAGWTSRARHDAAYVETSDGLKFVLVIFTENHAGEKDAIPAIAGRVVDGLRGMKK